MPLRFPLPWLVHVATPLALGAWLYIGYRSDRLLGWAWGRLLGVEAPARALRDATAALHVAPPDWLVYSLPDALWVHALGFAVARVWNGVRGGERLVWLVVPALLGPGAELAQEVGLLPGTFDPLDLLLCTAALLTGLFSGGAFAGYDRPTPRLASRRMD